MAPPWIAALWMGFATTLCHSLGWLRGRFIGSLLFGMIGGPLAYYAGMRLGALDFGLSTLPTLSAIAIEWGVAMPAVTAMANRGRAPG